MSSKASGQFFTPAHVARSLVSWVRRNSADVLLDPSCGEGVMLAEHTNSRGIERDPYTAWRARESNPNARVDATDFFLWAADTDERFDCAAGNPPFIRYQSFKGSSKAAARSICEAEGVTLSGLSSAWVAFLITTSSLLKPGGRMAFVVPAEIGHAPYATALIEYLLGSFSKVQVVAVREKIFPRVSEDCWLLYCEGRGGRTHQVHFSTLDSFMECPWPPTDTEVISWAYLRKNWRGRLRPLLIPPGARRAYLEAAAHSDATRFGDFAKIGIGYITGDNDFFHLSRSQIAEHQVPDELLVPTVRRGANLVCNVIDQTALDVWDAEDQPCHLLCIPTGTEMPLTVLRYLESDAGQRARAAYKCRVRPVWYSVPGVTIPDYFLQYMSGSEVHLSANAAGAACTNSIHAVRITDVERAQRALPLWSSVLTKLSCELEGHPLGGGMLKLEPREAQRILFQPYCYDWEVIREARQVLMRWRHQTVFTNPTAS
ncbi:N-6 DNA methylase [Rhizobium leguminosarum]|uniref:N-6 DNA methylase n=1 Tax=Rhizobium leguminosarum TaxID=384 RepID=UPI001FED8B10|nr:N-6 DNA methylase [Rhizobium leguminosarum]